MQIGTITAGGDIMPETNDNKIRQNSDDINQETDNDTEHQQRKPEEYYQINDLYTSSTSELPA